MATSNTVVLGALSNQRAPGRTFVNESVSFVTVAGDQNSFRAVPAGRIWLLQTLRAFNGEAGAHNLGFKLVDGGGTTHAVLVQGGVFPVNVPTLGELSWYGSVVVPELWTVRAYFLGMVGGTSVNWQYTAIEVAEG